MRRIAAKLLTKVEAWRIAANIAKLELVVRQRSRTIDRLNDKLEQVRAQNRRLDEETDRLAEMVRFAPQLDAAMLVPK